jgi:hypothetical protein
MSEVRVTDPVDAIEISKRLNGAGVTVRRQGGKLIVRAEVPEHQLKAAIRSSEWVDATQVKPRPWGWYVAAVTGIWGLAGWANVAGLW